MKILVACEESQALTKEFRLLGHEAYSCDIRPASGGFPEWHIEGDVTGLLNMGWDLIIGFPPCTYLTRAGSTLLYPQPGVINNERYEKGLEAREFFMKIWNANCDRVAIENPIPNRIYELPPISQIIQPFEHGHPYSKKTCLWLKGLPPVMPTELVIGNIKSWVGIKRTAYQRSKTFTGIAKAMADQWHSYLMQN